jgi:hypothetical protein
VLSALGQNYVMDPEYERQRKRAESIVWWISLPFRAAIFAGLLYGIERTPLRAQRVAAYLHLSATTTWFMALAMMFFLWWLADCVFWMLTGIPPMLYLFARVMKSKSSDDRSQRDAGTKTDLPSPRLCSLRKSK